MYQDHSDPRKNKAESKELKWLGQTHVTKLHVKDILVSGEHVQYPDKIKCPFVASICSRVKRNVNFL